MKVCFRFLSVPTAAFFSVSTPAAAVMAANAAGGSDVIVFTGNSTLMSGPIPTVGGAGTYSFAGNCIAHVSVPADGLDTTEVTSGCSIDSSGTFVNAVCGIFSVPGGVNGTASVTSPDGDFAIVYTMTIVASIGVLQGGARESDGSTGRAAGVMQILPTSGSCLTGVYAFAVTGVAAVGDLG